MFIVGQPIDVTRSPMDFPQALTRLKDRKASCKDADSVLLPLDVPPKGLDALVNGLAQASNCDGLIVTRPHKESILKHCTHLTAAARAVGCCNVVRFHKGAMIGTNMDGDGFAKGSRTTGTHRAARVFRHRTSRSIGYTRRRRDTTH